MVVLSDSHGSCSLIAVLCRRVFKANPPGSPHPNDPPALCAARKEVRRLLLKLPDYIEAEKCALIKARVFEQPCAVWTNVTTMDDFAAQIVNTEFATPFSHEFNRLYDVLKDFVIHVDYVAQLRAFLNDDALATVDMDSDASSAVSPV